MTASIEQAKARVAIFTWLDQKLLLRPWVTWAELVEGCPTNLGVISLAWTRGIWNPKQLDETLSIMISSDGPYADKWIDEAIIKYAYQGESGFEGNNTKLRRAMQAKAPIIVLQRIEQSIFVPRYPAYVVQDDLQQREFLVDLTKSITLSATEEKEADLDKSYRDQKIKVRIHQPRFRAQVLRAYEEVCAVCELRHIELLDAAHILPDAHPDGIAAVRNGLALCKLHHSAYDKNLMGISPDYTIRIQEHLLLENDGPMLKHGLQEMEKRRIRTPKRSKHWPDKDGLAERFEIFQRSGIK